MSNPKDPVVLMFAQACELMDQASRMHRQFFRPVQIAQSFATWEPPIDLYEDEEQFVVVVAMPGVSADDVRVRYEPGEVVVHGTRGLPFRGARRSVRRLEIPYGDFERRIALPPGRYEGLPPELAQGCLVLTLKKLV
jgi:HSP20 family molecular chaperone IbpA